MEAPPLGEPVGLAILEAQGWDGPPTLYRKMRSRKTTLWRILPAIKE